jgi:methylmalonyl-CoA/ethylmalonyl-CoA epimerase
MSDPSSLSERYGLGPIDQVSYAVRSLEAALPRFGALFGPFTTLRAELDNITYRGRSAQAVLNIAFGRSGPLEIELVEVVSGEAPQAEFLARHGEGLHHVRFVVQDIDEKLALLSDGGFTEVIAGAPPGVRFAYLENPAFLGDTMIELIQWTAAT